ncbi:hypothetical protein DKW60_10995 [Leucothrix pacifica]|uniref:Uncharacterized protein n=1 Tax=Leucothrix pacifica TaxID=1247513 RepID=A0A317CFW7_9GAMM|nr:hypothetical protein DKW60_10995 [Leucothrix pacifica]
MNSIFRFSDEPLVNVFAKIGGFEEICLIWKAAIQFGKKISKLDATFDLSFRDNKNTKQVDRE